jgi:hypothetical protein
VYAGGIEDILGGGTSTIEVTGSAVENLTVTLLPTTSGELTPVNATTIDVTWDDI